MAVIENELQGDFVSDGCTWLRDRLLLFVPLTGWYMQTWRKWQ